MTVPPRADSPDREPRDGSSSASPTINGRYVVERELGRGGIGVVYLARDLRLHEMPVVIKFLLDDWSENAWLSRKFLQEAEALTRIHHPGVVRVIDRDQTADGRPFFVMEFVKGVSLRSVIQPTGLDLEFAAAIVRDVGQALSAAHLEGVLHRDLKPENIMLETLSNGVQHAKLIDFGIAKVRDSRESAPTELGTMAGSLRYMAPEQLLGGPASVASDVYAFAVVAYELLTGRRPFNPDAPNQIAAMSQLMALQRAGQIVPPQQLRPGVSAAAQAIVLRGLSFEPSARLADAKQFGDDLAQALREPGERVESIVAPTPVAPPATPRPPERRRGWLVALAVTAALGAVLGFAYLAATWSSPAVPPALQKVESPEGSRAVATTAAEVRTLTYSVTLQRDPARYPGSKPVRLAREAIFSAGDRVRLAFTSPQGGFLYIFNEGPPHAGSPGYVNILFPSPTANNASAEIAGGQTVTIPGHGDGLVFDKEQGIESLWIVWSRDAQPGLDAMKRWINEKDRGEVKAAADVERFYAFLREHAAPVPDVAVDDEARVTTLSGRANVFIRLVKLEHH